MEPFDANLDDAGAIPAEAPSPPMERQDQLVEGLQSDLSDFEEREPDAFAPRDEESGQGRIAAADRENHDVIAAVDLLAQVALQFDDPVSALDEGVEALAEALAERDAVIERQQHATAAVQVEQGRRHAEFERAYRHARLHRVGELVDLGYQLDQAVAITNANESDVHNRALAADRNPAEVIYRYALMNGYRPQALYGRPKEPGQKERAPARFGQLTDPPDRGALKLAALTELSDDAFSRATRGDRWQALLRGK